MRVISISAMALTILCATTVCGYERGRLELTIKGAAAVPTGEFGKFANTGGGIDIGAGIYVVNGFSLGIEGGARTYSASDDVNDFSKWYYSDPTIEVGWEASHFSGYAKFMAGGPAGGAYFKIGVGSYKLTVSTSSDYYGEESNSISDVGLTYATGLQFSLSKAVGGILECSYTGMSSEENQNFQDWQIGAGLVLTLGD